MLENTKGTIQNGQPRETGSIAGTQDEDRNTQYNMCWTPLQVSKHKEDK